MRERNGENWSDRVPYESLGRSFVGRDRDRKVPAQVTAGQAVLRFGEQHATNFLSWSRKHTPFKKINGQPGARILCRGARESLVGITVGRPMNQAANALVRRATGSLPADKPCQWSALIAQTPRTLRAMATTPVSGEPQTGGRVPTVYVRALPAVSRIADFRKMARRWAAEGEEGKETIGVWGGGLVSWAGVGKGEVKTRVRRSELAGYSPWAGLRAPTLTAQMRFETHKKSCGAWAKRGPSGGNFTRTFACEGETWRGIALRIICPILAHTTYAT